MFWLLQTLSYYLLMDDYAILKTFTHALDGIYEAFVDNKLSFEDARKSIKQARNSTLNGMSDAAKANDAIVSIIDQLAMDTGGALSRYIIGGTRHIYDEYRYMRANEILKRVEALL